MKKFVSCVGAVLLTACQQEATTAPIILAQASDSSSPLSTQSALPIASVSPVPAPSQVRDHNYDDHRGWDYYYIGALSEEDRKKGRATGKVSTFQYLGKNSDNEFVLASMNDDGSVAYKAKCSRSCKVIDTSYGGKIAYAPQSLIGAAFQDAFRGKLQVADWAKDEVVKPAPRASTTSSAAIAEPPFTDPISSSVGSTSD